MTQDFYVDKVESTGIQVIVPTAQDIELINCVIYAELCFGITSEASKQEYIRIISELGLRGAQDMILGYTEMGLPIRQKDATFPVFDTTKIHTTK